MLDQGSEQMLLKRLSQGDRSAFWQLWVQHQKYLYSRCLTWMGGDRLDAEEALSRVRLKAWDKLPKYASKIANLKAWLTRVTHNLCTDIHRERARGATGIESIEAMAATDEEVLISGMGSPESAMLRRELLTYIHNAIDSLPPGLRDAFILRCCQEMPYSEIAQQLALSQENVRKRVQQAREILQQPLKSYLSGVESSPSVLLKERNSGLKHLAADEPTIPARKALGCIPEQINHEVTTTCLELLPHVWYSSPSLLGWR